MKPSHGEVTVNDAPTKARLFRFCEKKIDQWLSSHSELTGPDSSEIDFRVAFIEEEETRQIACETEIRVAGSIYKGHDLAGDTQQAFMQSMKRLQPVH